MKTDNFRITKKYDRRIKLTDKERGHIKILHKSGIAIREIARQYEDKCCRRTIQFILFPERNKKLKDIVKEEKRWLKYHTTASRREYMRGHRKYKRQLIKEGKINLCMKEQD